MSDQIVNIGTAVKELRKKNGWSQMDLIERSGLGKTTIQTIESGKNDNPEYQTLQTIFRTLGYDSIPLSIKNLEEMKLANDITSFMKSHDPSNLHVVTATLNFLKKLTTKNHQG